DPDFPANALTFSLDAGAPTGAAINSSTGEFSFTPSAAQAGQTFEISVRVTDNGNPELVDSETITITVDEVNFPPVLNPIADRNANVGQTLTFTATASDPDLPANNLTFSLGAGAPAGATINPGTGVFSWTPSAAQGGQTFEITVRATDDREPALSDTETFEVTVQPLVEPQFTMSAINGPNVAVPGQLRSYFVTFSDTGAGETYTATIDWGDGTVDNGFVAATSSGGNTTGTVSFWHTYTTIGDRTVQLTLRDGDGNEQTAQTDVTVQLITFQPDPLDDVRRSLVVGGFEAVNDQITFVPAAGGVNVLYNGYDHGRFAFDGSVVAFGQSGDDTIVVNPSFTRSAMLFGQAGNDQLIGGGGSNVLVGGTGADMLFGSAARDLLFGGLGADHLQGHGPDGLGSADDGDLLASDFTVHEFDTERLASLFHRWTSSDTYAERLHNLRFEEHPALNNTTVFDDFEVDQLTGGQGQDWFLFLASDLVADPEAGEEGLGVPFN
ncbi:MAG: putative Ig domain-containing protein, partial [Pirellulales bacterium]